MTVETGFYYTDTDRNCVFKVMPSGQRYRWREESDLVGHAAGLIPSHVMTQAGRTLRVLFGLDELREKLVMQDADIDDRIIELYKVLLIHEHPVILRRARLRLTLDRVGDTYLDFLVAYEHHSQRFGLKLRRDVLEASIAAPSEMMDWTASSHTVSLFAEEARWVNIWRWSPQPAALEQLREQAGLIAEGRDLTMSPSDLGRMIDHLPRGSHLPAWAKQDLMTLYRYAKTTHQIKLQEKAFEARFGFEIESDWFTNQDTEDTDTLWQLLRALPDSHVEGNTKIRELRLDDISGGLYHPGTHDITIGTGLLGRQESLEDVVRHEVGHAVHEMNRPMVDAWLREHFGWNRFPPTNDGVDSWVAMMGGWQGLTGSQQREVRRLLITALGSGGVWSPAPIQPLPPDHPWYRDGFGPRLAQEASVAHWYGNYARWHRAGEWAFFMNYWYKCFFAVHVRTLDLVAKLPSDYAAMSDAEFFAELYAVYYDIDDPVRPNLPSATIEWLSANLGAPEPGAPAAE